MCSQCDLITTLAQASSWLNCAIRRKETLRLFSSFDIHVCSTVHFFAFYMGPVCLGAKIFYHGLGAHNPLLSCENLNSAAAHFT